MDGRTGTAGNEDRNIDLASIERQMGRPNEADTETRGWGERETSPIEERGRTYANFLEGSHGIRV